MAITVTVNWLQAVQMHAQYFPFSRSLGVIPKLSWQSLVGACIVIISRPLELIALVSVFLSSFSLFISANLWFPFFMKHAVILLLSAT